MRVKHTSFNFLLTPFNSVIWMRDEGLRIRDCLLSSLSKERAGGEATFNSLIWMRDESLHTTLTQKP